MGAADDGLAARGLQDDEYSEIEGDSCGSWRACDAGTAVFQLNRDDAIAGKPAPTFGPGAILNQSSRALTDFGERRRLRKLRFTLLRWLTRLGPRAMATPIASTSITTRWAMREVSGV